MTRLSGQRLALLVGVALATLPAVGHAQEADAGSTQRMNSIEGQIRALQEQLRTMRRDLSARDSQLRAAQRDAARAREEAERIQPAPVAVPQQPPPGPGLAGVLGQPGVPGGTAGSPINAPPGSFRGPESLGQQNAAVIQGPSPKGSFKIGGVTVTLGGFIDFTTIYRTRNETAGVSASFNAIPEPQSPNYHTGEFRESARYSRLALLAQGDIDARSGLLAYWETDFYSAAPTSNSLQTNSYTLRLRQAFAEYDNKDWGFTGLAGQAYSLLTMNKKGIVARQEALPFTTEPAFVPGFSYARQPQLRLVKTFADNRVAFGLSFENPQNGYYTGPNGLAPSTTIAGVTTPTVTPFNAGGSGFAPNVNYSTEIAPDIIAKVAIDPGFGHYEVAGLLKFVHDRVSVLGDGRNFTTLGGGVKVGARIPLLPKDKLYLHLSGMAGYGIGRYGSSTLPDAVVRPDGSPQPLPEFMAVVGVEGTPIKQFDVYAYAGTEQIGRYSFARNNRAYGYGNPFYVNSGCGVELSPLACTANTSGITGGTLGFAYRFLSGPFGTAQIGAGYEYWRRSIFPGTGGAAKGTDENEVLVTLRYLPFQ